MCNFSSSLRIYLEFSSDITHYKIFAWVNFGGCNLKVKVGMAKNTSKIGLLKNCNQVKMSNFHFDYTAA